MEDALRKMLGSQYTQKEAERSGFQGGGVSGTAGTQDRELAAILMKAIQESKDQEGMVQVPAGLASLKSGGVWPVEQYRANIEPLQAAINPAVSQGAGLFGSATLGDAGGNLDLLNLYQQARQAEQSRFGQQPITELQPGETSGQPTSTLRGFFDLLKMLGGGGVRQGEVGQ